MMIIRTVRSSAGWALAASNRAASWLLIVAVAAMLGLPAWADCALNENQSADKPPSGPRSLQSNPREKLFARENLIAWCIVPFDSRKRTPEERAAMLVRLGFKHFAYDWRAEHIPTFDAEIDALDRHGVSLDAFWVAPGELNRESRLILDVLKRHKKKIQLWVLLDMGADRVTGAEQERRIESAAAKLRPLAEEAAKIGCSVALYNHGGWFGEPENQLAIIDRLKKQGILNVGIVYNLHHGHDHLDRFAKLLAKMKPHLVALNLNGMDQGVDRHGRKILPLGQGALDLDLLRTIRDSGYRGRIGILGHTMDDALARLQDNLDGLDWLVPQLDGKARGPRPNPRTPVPPRPAAKPAGAVSRAGPSKPHDAALVAKLLESARAEGNAERGAEVLASPRFACLSCHKIGDHGGTIGPDLSTVGTCVKPEEIVESILWPKKTIKDGFTALSVATTDGKIRMGYEVAKTAAELVLRDPATAETFRIAQTDIEAIRPEGSLMPEGLSESMTDQERQDLVRFLLDLGRTGSNAASHLARHSAIPAGFPYKRDPIHPALWPNWQEPVNRDRVYDFYAKEAEYFMHQPGVPSLLPQFPGLDGGTRGHWGNQDEKTWADDRWNQTDLGTLLCGVFRGAGVTVPKGVCVRFGERGEMAACFNPETLCYEAIWTGGFIKFSPTRHGIMDGLIMDGTALPRPSGHKPAEPFRYHGFYRHGKRVIFSYRIGDREFLDEPQIHDGRFSRAVRAASAEPLAHLTHGGPAQWPHILATKGSLGKSTGPWPYLVDTIELPFKNPWNALLFIGDHGFLPDGSAMICTIQGDVWHVEGLDESLRQVRWRRFASGLHQALGLVVAEGNVYVLGRDQITRFHDLNHDGEADFYECFSNAHETSPGGHDFVSGLQRDSSGRFYTASSKQGLLRFSADGRSVEVVATGFRNPDGLGLAPEGTVTVPNSEGDSVPASMICEVRPGGHYGYPAPRNGRAPDLPLVYLPRGLDNSSAAQVTVPDDRFGPLQGLMLHFSYGAGSHFLVLREKTDGQPQGAVVPLPGDFRSGSHRARFNPLDGQLYVSGQAGWGTYTPDDGCFQRVRYTGAPVQLPTEFHAHENGVLLTFSRPLDPAIAGRADRHFAQVWNYHYSMGYGSPELSARHPGQPGHDVVAIRSAHVLADGKTLFLEIPDLQPVNQLHLHVRTGEGDPTDIFATVHKMAPPFSGFPGYRPISKTIAAHPILADMAALNHKPEPNRWRRNIKSARSITIEAGKNLSFLPRSFTVRAGEPIKLTFINPDAVPHNWALLRPGSLFRVGDLLNKIIAEPDAALRHYIPKTDDVLAYSDIVPAQDQFIIYFRAPKEKGRYPYVCTFPGHWMVMNGEMNVE
jgi:putative heme-binding domain-containing protein